MKYRFFAEFRSKKPLTKPRKYAIILESQNRDPRGVAQVVARQFRVLEAASSSPATSTNRKSRVYPCSFYWSNMVGERSLQAASIHLVYTFYRRLDAELARRSSESRHFDHMKIIRTFSYLESRSDYLFYLSILILIVRNENSLRQVFPSEA